jgi:hypothetical protein
VVTDVPAAELVPGDVVLVEAGDRVPADGRIVAAHSLEVDESSLTGESSPVPKGTAASPADAPLADRAGMAYMNTVVTRGRGEVVVTATGMGTEIGHLAGLLQATVDHRTPLQEQLHVLGKRLAVAAGVAVAAFFALGLLRGGSVADTVLSSVALAVAAIPEGLPAVVTVTLAVGVHQMAKRGAIVKRLSSVETLGATDRHLLRQDRHPDPEPDDRPGPSWWPGTAPRCRARGTAETGGSTGAVLRSTTSSRQRCCATTAASTGRPWWATPRRAPSSPSRRRRASTPTGSGRSALAGRGPVRLRPEADGHLPTARATAPRSWS